jgi:hypothetical protein
MAKVSKNPGETIVPSDISERTIDRMTATVAELRREAMLGIVTLPQYGVTIDADVMGRERRQAAMGDRAPQAISEDSKHALRQAQDAWGRARGN